MNRNFIQTLLFVLVFLTEVSFVQAKDNLEQPLYYQVQHQQSYLYQEPDINSPLVRRLYLGEMIKAVELIKTQSGFSWYKIEIGKDKFAYIKAIKLEQVKKLPENYWQPSKVIRSEKPLSLGMRVAGETYGAGVNLRYMPFSGLGLSITAGPVLDNNEMKGTAMSFGIVSISSTDKFSPTFELGISRFSYHDDRSALRISTFYAGLGVEYMHETGTFANLGLTYVRSLDTEVIYEFEDARDGNLTIGDYGKFNYLKDQNSLQDVNLSLTIGYAF